MAFEESTFSISIMDYSRELSNTKFGIVQLGAATFAAHITARDAWIDALEDVIDGTIQRSKSTLDKNFNSTAPGNNESSREKKILVTMADGTNMKKFNITIPCRRAWVADDWEPIEHSDEIDPATTFAAAFITACNNFIRSPYGNASTVIKLTAVGRNL